MDGLSQIRSTIDVWNLCETTVKHLLFVRSSWTVVVSLSLWPLIPGIISYGNHFLVSSMHLLIWKVHFPMKSLTKAWSPDYVLQWVSMHSHDSHYHAGRLAGGEAHTNTRSVIALNSMNLGAFLFDEPTKSRYINKSHGKLRLIHTVRLYWKIRHSSIW